MKTTLTFCLCIWVFTLQAQSSDKNVCLNRDCSEAIMSVEMSEPIAPTDGYTPQRTTQLIAAYQAFKQAIQANTADNRWQTDYQKFQLGGKNCLRYYQLESYFGHEYLKNPAFKKYVDEQGDGGKSFKQRGFDSSQRGINLERRMASKCPNIVKNQQKEKNAIRAAYMELGKDLGYFDENGQPTDSFVRLNEKKKTPQKPRKISKRKQVKQLKEEVTQLPTTANTQPALNKMSEDLAAVQEDLAAIKQESKDEKTTIAALSDEPLALKKEVRAMNESIDEIADFKPKSPRPELAEQLKSLEDAGKTLNDKSKNIADKGEKLQSSFAEAEQKSEQLTDDLQQSTQTVDELNVELAELEKAKTDLTEKLNNKPKKQLETLKKEVAKTNAQADNFENGRRMKK